MFGFESKGAEVPFEAKQSPPSVGDASEGQGQNVASNVDGLQRHLGVRQVSMIAVGGSIGTALFVSISSGLMAGGPGSLLIAFTAYSIILGLVNNCVAEMAIFMPVSGSFVRFAGKWVDPSFGMMAGWNFFLYEACLIPYEVSALILVLQYWSENIPAWAVVIACIVLYGLINVFAVKYYGEAEFWLSSGKFVLLLMLFSFTFVTMVGGNPQHDAYGFRYWREPGSFAEYITTGDLGRFQGFLGALWSAAFTIVGPEYIAMVAGETERPRILLKSAFKTMYWRFGFFYIIGALCVGISLPYNNPILIENSGGNTASASPYVIAMQNMGIRVLPDVTNALMVTSIFSAGNAYVYCGMRTLYGLALEGQAPAFLKTCSKSGIPYYCFAVTMCFTLLSLLAISNSSAQVVSWLASLTEASQLIDYIIICVTYIFFYRACAAQGLDRDTLPYKGWWQPYCAYIGLAFEIAILGCYGYETFLPGQWDIGTFFSYYAMIFFDIIAYAVWKVWKKTSVVKPLEADLIWDRPVIDAYEASFKHPPASFSAEVFYMLHIRQRPTYDDEESDHNN